MTNKKDIPRISDAEWQVMREFWSRGEATAADVVSALEPESDWKPKTIQTLIRRLTQKGALGFRKVGREHIYCPLVDEKSCEQAASRQFLNRVFNGRLAPFLANLVESTNLTNEEIAELKRLLDSNTDHETKP